MELVGVRNITCENNQTLDFEIEEGNILKILSVTHSGALISTHTNFTKLNGEYIYFTKHYGDRTYLPPSFPFYLSNGTHSLHSTGGYSTLYALEFKLTTP